jgi:hypothetical protein
MRGRQEEGNGGNERKIEERVEARIRGRRGKELEEKEEESESRRE